MTICKYCKKKNDLIFPQDYYLFVYTRDVSNNPLMWSDYRKYHEISFDCKHCNKRNKQDNKDCSKLVIIHENEIL